MLENAYWQWIDFNTSHVSINRNIRIFRRASYIYFNTSHVSINRILFDYEGLGYTISIHLMFLLITEKLGKQLERYTDFNTSHVSINHVMDALTMAKFSFQYISCFY